MNKSLILLILSTIQVSLCKEISRWDWASIQINIQELTLPALGGFSNSEYQVSGAFHLPQSQWASWGPQSGKACDFWNLYKNDIQLAKECGANSFRLSIDWSAIEPQRGKFNLDAINHYKEVIKELIAQNIEPMVTLHHFSHPQWFENMGGFAKRLNTKYFVRFCKKIFAELNSQVKLWCTINEIGPFVFQGYINGVFPPGKHNPYLALKVMANMMEAHCLVYHALKKMPGGQEAQIGLVHNYLSFETQNQTWLGLLNPLEQLPVRFMNYLFNDAMLRALKTDVLFGWNPILRTHIKGLSKSYDFIGLNFYSRVVIESRVQKMIGEYFKKGIWIDPVIPSCKPGEVMTDMDYAVCAEGLYYALLDVSRLKVPIYITENGIPDDRDDRRETFILRYLYALSKAMEEGIDVRGYYYWTLMDNYEWDHGYKKKFGLFEVNFVTQERTMRPGAHIYKKILQQKILA
jgi:beta-glucosidase